MKRCTKKKSGNSEKRTVHAQIKGCSDKSPIWTFENVDKTGIFAFDTSREDFQHKEVLDKILSYSTMTWAEIDRQIHDDGRSKHHYLRPGSLSKEAEKRLSAKHLDDHSDQIYSFALQNRLRIVGIREDEFFRVLWYDPNHEACIAHKKHT